MFSLPFTEVLVVYKKIFYFQKLIEYFVVVLYILLELTPINRLDDEKHLHKVLHTFSYPLQISFYSK